VAKSTAFGEFLFGWTDTDTAASPPILYAPLNGDSVNQQVPIVFRWTPRGYADGFQLQMSTDSLFGSVARNDSLLTTTFDTVKSFTPKVLYYWRVRSRNGALTGSWSQVWRFTSTQPYVSVTSPADKAVWDRGRSSFIIWRCNITARMRIDLYKNGVMFGLIADSVSNIGSYGWSIPSGQPIDSTYSIRLRSVSDTTVVAFTSGRFTIRSAPSAVDDREMVPDRFGLSQNYPNPFNGMSAIGFQIPAFAWVKLGVYDLLGREVAVLVNGERPAGNYLVQWNANSLASGVYICRLQAGANVAARKMILAR
jgi:hypothetical protein